MSEFAWFLTQASSLAPQVDALFWFMVALCGTVALGVICAIVYFSIRYRRGSPADRSGEPPSSLPVELTWTLIPGVLFTGVFIWSLFLFVRMRTPPADAQTIYIVAKQWMWKAQHAGGQREINTLHVPLGVPIRLTMTSQDVIHSFYVPAFRVKQDVLPGRYTQLWFKATKLGHYELFCAEYCGLDHSKMGGQIVVMRPSDYARWLEGHAGPGTLAAQGAALFRARGCSGCHGPNASVHAPDLDGLYGHPVQLAGGSQVIADERYIRDSIMLPDQHIVAGYQPLMPSFAGQLSEEDVLALIAYLKSTSESSHEHD
ncbi:MAG TPA: cytochrome c oxidase subunit II [Steroidobacteraceae bacterium]|jgi:cytochrome c oxidase subunit 2